MTVHDPSFQRPSGEGLLGWLRRSPRGDDNGSGTPAAGQSPIAPIAPHRLARAQLLGDVTDFLLAHELEINGFTLAVAHDYLTGADGRMMRLIDQRIQGCEALTVEWLKQISHETGDDERDVLNRMMHRLETNIDAFDRTSSAAKTAASDYSEALTAHVGDLGQTAPNDANTPSGADTHVVQELLTLARSMVERTANLEQDMARSLLETRALRRSLEQARRSAEEDHLTGLPNRRAFEHRFTAEFAAAREAGEQLAVAFCDIDNFKRVNDEHGHEAGDRVLKSVASSLAHISDDRCHVARHGGEEFVVLLRGRSLHQAWELLDDARAAMAERRMVNRATDTPYGKVTFSGGIADVFAFPDPRAALRAADRALYRAKSEGRNRILVANPASDLAGWPAGADSHNRAPAPAIAAGARNIRPRPSGIYPSRALRIVALRVIGLLCIVSRRVLLRVACREMFLHHAHAFKASDRGDTLLEHTSIRVERVQTLFSGQSASGFFEEILDTHGRLHQIRSGTVRGTAENIIKKLTAQSMNIIIYYAAISRKSGTIWHNPAQSSAPPTPFG